MATYQELPNRLNMGNDRVMVGCYDDTTERLILNVKSELMMLEKPAIYKSFLIRIWSNKAGSKRRVMVTRIDEAGEQYYFANLDDLMIFLLQEMEKPVQGELPMV
jgi:hypothetical protein